MQGIIKRHKKFVIAILFIVGIGVLLGISYYLFLNNDAKLSLASTIKTYNNFGYNFILKDLIILSLILVLSFLLLGSFLGLLYIFYESVSVGFLIALFSGIYGMKGLIYIFLYLVINKLITFILKIIFIKKSLNISRSMIGSIIYKKDSNLKAHIFISFRNSLYIIVFILIVNIILYFLSPRIFNNFTFLIK